MNRIIAGLIITLLPCAALAQGASTTADRVPIEEYAPKVIIEGKWGTGPGEFGVAWTYADNIEAPESPSGGASMPIYPSSLAVDSSENIYVLDTVNNRIQKFGSRGKFLKSLSVESYMGEEQPIWYGKVKTADGREILDKVDSKAKSGNTIGVDKWFPFYWPITAAGINIVIDSKDDLYYYLKRVKDGKESGEVWQFRNDKLVKKTKVPVGGSIAAGQGIVRDESDDSVWIFNIKDKAAGVFRSHEVKENKSYTGQQRDERYKGVKRPTLKSKQTSRTYMRVSSEGIKVIRE